MYLHIYVYNYTYVFLYVNIMFIIEMPNECKIVRIVHMCINPKPIFTLRQKKGFFI